MMDIYPDKPAGKAMMLIAELHGRERISLADREVLEAAIRMALEAEQPVKGTVPERAA